MIDHVNVVRRAREHDVVLFGPLEQTIQQGLVRIDLALDDLIVHCGFVLGQRLGGLLVIRVAQLTLTLNGLPITGQGAKLRIAFAGDGSVTQLSDSLRKLERGKDVPIISVAEAAKQCAALYAPGFA